MAQITTNISADVNRRNITIHLRGKQGDAHSRTLTVRVCNDGEFVPVEQTGNMAIINVEREDGQKNAYTCTINEDGTITAPIPAFALANVGWVRCSISVVGTEAEDVKLTTQTIMLQVEAIEYTGENIDEDENYDILVDLLAEAQAVIDAFTGAIDPTLTVSGAAADASVTGRRIRGIVDGSGIVPVMIAEFKGGYISSATIGSTMSFTRTANADFASAIMEVAAGDVVTITVTGTGSSNGTGAFAYTITDSSKAVLAKSSRNAALTDELVTMPENAAYIVINNKISSQSNYSAVMGETNQVEKIAQDVVEDNAETLLATKDEVNRIDAGLELAHRRIDGIWAFGRVNGSTGAYTTASALRRRTTSPLGVVEGVYAADARGTGYSFYVYAYRRSGSPTYVGAWDDVNQTWIAASTGFSVMKYFDFSQYPEYKFQLVLLKDNDDYIYAADTIEVYFDASPVNNNIAKIDAHERILHDIVQPAVVYDVNTIHITSNDASRVNAINAAYIRSELISYSDYGTIAGTVLGDVCYYVQTAKDSVVYINTNHPSSKCCLRTSAEVPAIGTSTVWSGQISRTMPTRDNPWVVPAGQYVTFCAERGLGEDEFVDICIAPLGYDLSDEVKSRIRATVEQEDYYPGENLERTSDVYAALDAIEAASGNRMSHAAISDNIDDNTPIRAYVINTSPKRMAYDYTTVDEPFFDKPQFLITGCIHGNERGNAMFLISFVKNLLSNPEYSYIAGQFEWHIIPVVNVWGFNHTMVDGNGNVVWYDAGQVQYTIVPNTASLMGGVRNNADDININRDFSDTSGFQTAEARAVRDYFLANNFCAAIDFHQWWNATQRTVMGFCSMAPNDSTALNKYRRCWCEMAAGGKEAEDYIRGYTDDPQTKYQMVLMWGKDDSVTTTATVHNYFGGAANNTLHRDKAILFSSTMESSMLAQFLTNSSIPYQPLAQVSGNVFTQRMIVAIARAALAEVLY